MTTKVEEFVELIDELIKARAEHLVYNRHNHEYPSSESDIYLSLRHLSSFIEENIEFK